MLVGRVIGGRYRVLRKLGAGGMGEVYEAEQSTLGLRVAVKSVTTDDPSTRARFRQEALAMAKLQMSRVVNILDFVEDGADVFLVMQLLEGETLHALLRRERQLDVARAVTIATQMLEALGAVHRVGIIHREVKPSNVFLVRGGAAIDVKLIDFGIAKLAADGLVSTTTGAAIGTPAYMAPEQLQGIAATPATDVHAVGVCLFEMLIGRRPWRSTQSGAALAAEILRDEPFSLRELVPTMPAQLEAIVHRAMAKDPARRYPDAAAMLADLGGDALPSTRVVDPQPRPLASVGPSPTTKTLPVATKTRSWVIPVAIAAAAALGGAATFAFLRHAPPPVSPVSPPATRSITDAEWTAMEEEAMRSGRALGSLEGWESVGPPSECWCAFDGYGPVLCPTKDPASCTAQVGMNGGACRGVVMIAINRNTPSGLLHPGKLVCGKGRPPNGLAVGPRVRPAASNADPGF